MRSQLEGFCRLAVGAAGLALAGFSLPTVTPARADVEYPYCGYGREGSGGCMYATLEQCRAFINGAGGDCYPNPRYPANSRSLRRPRR